MAKTPVPAKPEQPKAEEKPDTQNPPAVDPKPDQTDAEQLVAPRGAIPARILVDHGGHRCNTLALLTEAEARDCKDWADLSHEAVEYAASQTAPAELEKLKASIEAD